MSNIVNVDDVAELAEAAQHWQYYYKPLTPALMPSAGHLGVNLTRVPPGDVGCPLHTHQLEDEVFFVLSGRGVFRYGDTVREIKPGDCISCPAASGIGHQIANPFQEDLLYLAIGLNDPNEVCTYPDSGKIFMRGLQLRGFLATANYMDNEPNPPRVFLMPVDKGAD